MKIRVTLKDPDGFYDCVRDAVKADIAKISGLDDEERESMLDARVMKVNDVLGRWVEYGEYVDIEFDTDAKTATVCEKGV